MAKLNLFKEFHKNLTLTYGQSLKGYEHSLGGPIHTATKFATGHNKLQYEITGGQNQTATQSFDFT